MPPVFTLAGSGAREKGRHLFPLRVQGGLLRRTNVLRVLYVLGTIFWFLTALTVAMQDRGLDVATSFIACILSASFCLGLILMED